MKNPFNVESTKFIIGAYVVITCFCATGLLLGSYSIYDIFYKTFFQIDEVLDLKTKLSFDVIDVKRLEEVQQNSQKITFPAIQSNIKSPFSYKEQQIATSTDAINKTD